MKRLAALAVFALALALALPELAQAGSAPPQPRMISHGLARTYVEGEVLVKFRGEYKPSAWADTVRRLGGKTLHVLNLGNQTFHHVRARAGISVQQAIDEFTVQDAVEYAQPNYIYHASSVTPQIPDDPSFNQQWGLNNTGQSVTTGIYGTANPGTAGKDMSLESAWGILTDCSSVTVAIVDTGVNYNHTDLAANMWTNPAYPNHGYNFVDGNDDPMDLNGHGTHVAGIVGAVGNNGIGTTGICWKASLMAVRVLDPSGSGTTETITQGVSFAVQNGARVINMSLGGNTADPTFEEAIETAAASGVAVVVAAGNSGANNDSGTTPSYPCNYTESNLICVAALDQSFNLATFSNYGSSSVDIGAPGTNVLSTWPGTNVLINDGFNTTGALNWSLSGTGWGYQNMDLNVGTPPVATPFDMLTLPANWDNSTIYPANLSSDVYKTFDLTAASSASLNFEAFVNTAATDPFNIAYGTTTADPFVTGSQLDTISTQTGSSASVFTYDLTPCKGLSTCTVGFQFKSGANPAAGDTGVAIVDFNVNQLEIGTTGFQTLDGTSMATPHVAGLMAMVMALNPMYGPTDAIQAILGGGVANPALAGKTTSGNSANALGALTYIATPSGVKVEVPVP